jgi:hypothetical protein
MRLVVSYWSVTVGPQSDAHPSASGEKMETAVLGIFEGFELTWWMVAMWILAPVLMIAWMCASIHAARRGKPTAGPVLGSLVFRYPPFMRWGSICVAVGALVGITGLVVIHPPQDPGDTFAIVCMYVVSAAVTGALLWECVRLRLVVGPDGLEFRSPWLRRQFIGWGDVVDMSFNGPLGWFDIRATDRRGIRMPAQVGGLEAFLEACEQRLTPGQLERALAAYLFLGRTFPGE